MHSTLINKRLRALRSRAKIMGTASRPRLSVFRSNRSMYVQLIDDENGKTIAAASKKDIAAKGKLTKIEVAALIGEALAKKAGALHVSRAVFHKGSYRYHGRVKALADGARKGGLQF